MDIKKIALVSLLSSTVMLGGCNLCGSSTKPSSDNNNNNNAGTAAGAQNKEVTDKTQETSTPK